MNSILAGASVMLAASVPAHPGHPMESASDASTLSGKPEVSITIEGQRRVIRSNGITDDAGQFPNPNNPGRIAPQNYTFYMPLQPIPAAQPTSIHHDLFGVALNGVPFDPGTAEFWNNDRRWNYEALSGYINLGVDRNNAHVQPGGVYHYHGLPTGLSERLGRSRSQMVQIGWAADGFPIYTGYGYSNGNDAKSSLKKMRSSWQLKKGDRTSGPGGKYDGQFTADYEFVKGSGDLDECNGRFGATPEFPNGIYHYYITAEFPFVPRHWRGTPDASFTKHGPGPGPGRPGGPGFDRPFDRP